MDDYLQKKRRSVTASPVGSTRLPSTNSTTSGNKARLKQQPNNFVTVPTVTSHIPYSSQPQTHHQYNYTGWTPEGENMERKVKQALMTELAPKSKPSGKNDTVTKSFPRMDNNRLHPKNTTVSPQVPQQGAPLQHQSYRASPSVSAWPGEDFHSGNTEMTPEPPSIPAGSKLDISEFDPIETKNK